MVGASTPKDMFRVASVTNAAGTEKQAEHLGPAVLHPMDNQVVTQLWPDDIVKYWWMGHKELHGCRSKHGRESGVIVF